MSSRSRVTAFVAVVVLLGAVAGAWVVVEVNRASARAGTAPTVAIAPVGALDDGPRVVFRNTEVGTGYGLAAMVSLADPSGPRALTDIACDRVYATARDATCLRTKRGIVTSFEALVVDHDWKPVTSWALPGIPSRTRVSRDGQLAATTSFVTGHSYMQVGFSTATQIRSVDGAGTDSGDLESFGLVIDGRRVAPVDRNVWGVTFGGDENTFYATVATGGDTWLVRGDLAARTLTSVRKGVECPSLSPDGTHIAYKHAVAGSARRWQIAVLEIATGRETVLAGERRSVDDQVEWLDDGTVLYGLPRAGEAGVSDIWQLGTGSGSTPSLFIEQAWSPSVVRS